MVSKVDATFKHQGSLVLLAHDLSGKNRLKGRSLPHLDLRNVLNQRNEHL